MGTRLLAACLILALAWPAPAYGLRPVNAGQEESAVAQLTNTLTSTGLEEDATRRPVGPPSAVEFPWLVDTAAFQAERTFLAPYQLNPDDAGARLHQLMLDATLKGQFQLWSGDSLTSWLAKIPVYLVTDPAVWAAYVRRVGAADSSPAIVRISKIAGTIMLVFNARSLTLGLWIREGIRAQVARQFLWELLWQRRQAGATSPLTSGWLAAMRETEAAWHALLGQARSPELTRILRDRLMELARRGPLFGRPSQETAWESLRNPAIIEAVATLYTVLLIPDWPLAPPALRDLASWSRRMDASHPIRQWLTAAWATVLGLPDPWVGATVLGHDPEVGVPPVPLRMIRRFEHATAVAFSPRGDTAAVVEEERTIRLWHLPQWEEAWRAASTPRETFTAITFDADSQSLVAVMDLGTIARWDVTTGALTATISPVHDGRVVATAFDPDRQRVALGWWDGTVTLQTLTALGQGTSCSFREVDKALAFDPSGRFLAVGGEWGTLGLWDIEQQRFTWQFVAHAGRIAALAFSPDAGALFSAGADGTLARWNVSTAEAVWERTVPSRRWTTLAVGPGGRLLAVGGEHGPLRWYEAMTGRSVGASLPAWVERLAWFLTWPWLATLGPGRTLTIWDARLALVWDRLWSAQVPPDVAKALQTARQILERPLPDNPIQHAQDVLDLRAAVRLWHAAILEAPDAPAHQGFGSLDGYSRDLLRTMIRDRIALAQALTTVGRARTLINEWLETTVPGLPRIKTKADADAWRAAPLEAPVEARYDEPGGRILVTYPMTEAGLEEGVSRRRFLGRALAGVLGVAVAPAALLGQERETPAPVAPPVAMGDALFLKQREFLRGASLPRDAVDQAFAERVVKTEEPARAAATTLRERFRAAGVTIYLIPDLAAWRRYLALAGDDDGAPGASVTRFSLRTGEVFIAGYAPLFDIGLWLHECVHAAIDARLWRPVITQRQQPAPGSSPVLRRLAAVFDRERTVRPTFRVPVPSPRWDPADARRAQRRMVARFIRGRVRQAAQHPLPHVDEPLAPEFDVLRARAMGETLAWLYQLLLIPAWQRDPARPEDGRPSMWRSRWDGRPLSPEEHQLFDPPEDAMSDVMWPAMRQVAAELRALPPTDPVRRWLTQVYTHVLQLPDPWPSVAAVSSKGGLEETSAHDPITDRLTIFHLFAVRVEEVWNTRSDTRPFPQIIQQLLQGDPRGQALTNAGATLEDLCYLYLGTRTPNPSQSLSESQIILLHEMATLFSVFATYHRYGKFLGDWAIFRDCWKESEWIRVADTYGYRPDTIALIERAITVAGLTREFPVRGGLEERQIETQAILQAA